MEVASESYPQFSEKVFKAQTEVAETRGTASPTIITSLLAGMLLQVGYEVNCPRIRKRIGDDCIWSEGAKAPWRRSPAYLTVSKAITELWLGANCTQLRIALRRLAWMHFDSKGIVHYKFIIASMLACVLPRTLGSAALEQVDFLKTKLSRRIAKLEVFHRMNDELLTRQLMDATSTWFSRELETTKTRIEKAWEQWKQSNRKQVMPFRSPTAPASSWDMKLFNSL